MFSILLRAIFIFFILLTTHSLSAKPPELSPRDTRIKIEEILKAHVSHHSLTKELIGRALINYIDELDPIKTYFIESDIAMWIHPTEDTLHQTLEGIHQENFAVFELIHEQMIQAIERRNQIETLIEASILPNDVTPTEFKEIHWAKDEAELTERLLRI